MAIYTPGITDYIPEAQPFQPDYNFLNNTLQIKQGMYDQNYSKLNSQYGKLLNAPLSRQDTTTKRDAFFKAIDGDIKRISGMDLSLQQNVDATSKVFDSFFQNKDIFYDMAFTKEHNRQLGIGDAYKNCIDQEKCGGKYWDTGVQALNYRMDEFKKAPIDQAMKMSNMDYTPFVNIQEKATKYLSDLLGSKGGGFGVKTVQHDPSGRFLVSLTNGQNILGQFDSLLYTQYSQDPDIKAMFRTKSYVDRKNYIQQYAPTYGSEDAAEDKWFELLRDDYVANMKTNIDVQIKKLGEKARYELLLKTLKDQGSTGDDPLATDVINSGIVSDLSTRVADMYQKVLDSAANLFQNGTSRDMKRSIADSYHSDKVMRNAISTAVMNSVSMTGTEEWEEDPYVKSDYEFGHDMALQADKYAREKENIEFKGEIDVRTALALGKFKNPDGTYSDINGNLVPPPSTVVDEKGTTAVNVDEYGNILNTFDTRTKALNDEYAQFTGGYFTTLKGILDSDTSTPQEKALANSTLINIFGKYVTENDKSISPYIDPLNNDRDFNSESSAYGGRDRIPYGNKVIHAGWDVKTKSFRDKNGRKIESMEDIQNYFVNQFGDKDLPNYYQRTKTQMNLNKNIQSHKGYIDRPDVKALDDKIQIDDLYVKSTRTLFQENAKNIKSNLKTKLGALDDSPTPTGKITERDAIDLLISSKGEMLSKEDFIKAYNTKFKDLYAKKVVPVRSTGMAQTQVASGTGYGTSTAALSSTSTQDASKFYDSLHNKFVKTYNEGVVVTDPVTGEKTRTVKSINTLYTTGGGTGGVEAKAKSFTFNSQTPNTGQTKGAVSFLNDALNSKNLLANFGEPVNDKSGVQAGNLNLVKSAISQLRASMIAGDKKLNGLGSYLNLALSSTNWEGMKIVLPTDYLQQFVSKDKKAGNWADKLLEAGGVFTTYIPKTDAKTSTFTKAHQADDYDFILDMTNVDLQVPGGGKMTVQKRTADGLLNVTGYLDVINPDGTEAPQKIFTNSYPAETGGGHLIRALNEFMTLNATTIDAYRKGLQPQNKLNDFMQLKQVKERLDIMSGDDPTPLNPIDIFYNPGLLRNGR